MTTQHLADLEGLIDGEVIVRASMTPDERPFNARFDAETPEAIVRCTSEEDIAETIAFIRRHRLDSATRSGGHCFAGRSTTTGVVIDVSPISGVRVADGAIRVGAGAVLGEVYSTTIPHGSTIPGGTCPSVGVAGLTLGGGLGILGRTYGLTSDRLVEARVVLADGRAIGCDEHHEAELFWALRGGGTGSFGVVTELTFDPVPTPATTNLRLVWPSDAASAVATAWMHWSPNAPDALSASLLVSAGPHRDQEPTVEVVGTLLRVGVHARELVDGLVASAGSDPSSTVIEDLSYEDTMRLWAAHAGERLDDPRATPAARAIHLVKSEFFARPPPPEATSALVQRLIDDRVEGQARGLDFSPWGGAYNRMPADATAFVHRDAAFWIKHEATVAPGSGTNVVGAARSWVDGSWNVIHPWGTGGVFPNFADPDLEDWGHAYYGSNFERLCRIKALYDPHDLFRSRQSLPVA